MCSRVVPAGWSVWFHSSQNVRPPLFPTLLSMGISISRCVSRLTNRPVYLHPSIRTSRLHFIIFLFGFSSGFSVILVFQEILCNSILRWTFCRRAFCKYVWRMDSCWSSRTRGTTWLRPNWVQHLTENGTSLQFPERQVKYESISMIYIQMKSTDLQTPAKYIVSFNRS